MGLVPGERLPLRDALYGLLLPSGNDAALAIAGRVGGTIPAFVALMNAEAQRARAGAHALRESGRARRAGPVRLGARPGAAGAARHGAARLPADRRHARLDDPGHGGARAPMY